MKKILDLDILYKFLNNKLDFKERSEFIRNINSLATNSLLKEIKRNAKHIKDKNSKNLSNYYFHIFLFFSKVFETEKLKELLREISRKEKNLLYILESYIGSCLNKGCKELKYSVNFDWEDINIFERLSEIVSHPYDLELFNDMTKLIFAIYQIDKKIAINMLKKDKHHIVFSLFVYYYWDTFKLLEYKNFAKEFLKSNDLPKKYALFLPILEKIKKLNEDKNRYCEKNLDNFTKKEKEVLKIDCKKLGKELRVYTLVLFFLFKYIEDDLERAEVFLSASMFSKTRSSRFLFFVGFIGFANIINCKTVEQILNKVWKKSYKFALDFYKLLVILDKEVKCTDNQNIKDFIKSFLLIILNDNPYEEDINLWKEIIRYLIKWNLKDFLKNFLENKIDYIEKTYTVDKYLHYDDYLKNKEKTKVYKKILNLIEEV